MYYMCAIFLNIKGKIRNKKLGYIMTLMISKRYTFKNKTTA